MLNLQSHVNHIRQEYEDKKSELALREQQQLKKLSQLKNDLVAQRLLIDERCASEQLIVSRKENLELELSKLTVTSLAESTKALALEDKQCGTDIEQLTAQLAKLHEENARYKAMLKQAGKVHHSHEKQYKKQLKEYNKIQNEIKAMRDTIDVLNGRTTKAHDLLFLLSEELHEPAHELVEQPAPTSITAQLTALDKLYEGNSASSTLYRTPPKTKEAENLGPSSAKKPSLRPESAQLIKF